MRQGEHAAHTASLTRVGGLFPGPRNDGSVSNSQRLSNDTTRCTRGRSLFAGSGWSLRGEHSGEIVSGEGRGLPPASVGGRAAVARQHPRSAFPGGRGLAGEPPIQGAAGGAVGDGGGGGNRGGREAARGGDGARQWGAGGGVGREGVSHHTD